MLQDLEHLKRQSMRIDIFLSINKIKFELQFGIPKRISIFAQGRENSQNRKDVRLELKPNCQKSNLRQNSPLIIKLIKFARKKYEIVEKIG